MDDGKVFLMIACRTIDYVRLVRLVIITVKGIWMKTELMERRERMRGISLGRTDWVLEASML